MKMDKIYISHDQKFGPIDFNFTLPEMIKQYRMCGWDDCDNGIMSDQEIIEDILENHNVELIGKK